MSVDLLSKNQQLQPYYVPPLPEISGFGPAKDIVIVFQGWGGLNLDRGPHPIRNAKTGAGKLAEKVLGLASPGRSLLVKKYSGSLMFDSGSKLALDFIRGNFHPNGKIVIYGYSAGGSSALRLATGIGQDMRYFHVKEKKFYSMASYNPDLAFVRVDGLVTIDTAAGPASRIMYRHVPICVRENLNYYQRVPATRERGASGQRTQTGAFSHGGPNTAINRGVTIVRNFDVTHRFKNNPRRGHGNIDESTSMEALTFIRQILQYS